MQNSGGFGARYAFSTQTSRPCSLILMYGLGMSLYIQRADAPSSTSAVELKAAAIGEILTLTERYLILILLSGYPSTCFTWDDGNTARIIARIMLDSEHGSSMSVSLMDKL